ncbi:gluconokinase [Pedobacter sp. Leaf176]|uniref:gluconokinase n=1 Tax=Pedobacter sp. Leaf176 TaxID=1736286 RepID=UPI0006F92A87|nr:gluconokinase [Pedobacter sp. Leaf176]KQR72676.1 gluconokinase [Pedobacter sp. Leaf176]
MNYLIGLDIGTGSTKAVALNLQYEPITSSQFFYPTESLKPGYSEQDPGLIWEAFVSCIKELINKLQANPICIGLSSAMHSLILVDETHRVLSPMMTWADNRSSEEAKQLKESEAGLNVYKASGTPIHSMSPLCKLIWLQKNDPELIAKTKKFISIKEYIWFKLFGEYRIDYSIASCSGLFNIHTKTWDKQALELAGITDSQLSTPVSTDYYNSNPLPTIFEELSTSFVIGASDGCLANLGSEATADGLASVTIGTSGALRLASPKPIFNPSAMTFSYILDDKTYICGGPINNGGRTLQWLLKNIFKKEKLHAEDYQNLFEQVENTASGSNGLIFLPYLAGERAPIWDSEACGTFFGLNLKHEQKHLARAVVEGICYALKDVLEAVEGQSETIRQIHVSGGFTHSKIWMQILADVTGKKLALVLEEDASAVGAAYLAAKAMGLTKTYPVSANKKQETIEPDLKKYSFHQKNFMLFKQLYANLSITMHQLYHLNG